jgi:hypothetical protein
LNLVFLTTHLPTYLAICGQDPLLSAEAIAVISGMNCSGSLTAGWLGADTQSTFCSAASIFFAPVSSPPIS